MTIFSKIGNFFKNNASNIGKGLQIGGSAAMAVGAGGMLVKAFNSQTSIFGCGCGMGGFGMPGFGGYGMPGLGGYGMPGMGGFGMPGMGGFGMPGYGIFGMGGYNMGGCSIFGGGSDYASMYGMQQAFMRGQYDAIQSFGAGGLTSYNPTLGSLTQFNNPYGLLNNSLQQSPSPQKIDLDKQERVQEQDYKTAALAADEGDKKKGEKFVNDLNQLAEKDITSVKFKEKDEDYTEAISKYGKDYVRAFDDDGNGTIDDKEYAKHEVKNSKLKDVKESETYSKLAFRKIDQNRDGKIDWKEMGAVLATFDKDKDGAISQSELTAAGDEMTQLNKSFDSKVNTNYREYFRKTES